MFDSIVFMTDIETRPLKPEKQLYTRMLSVDVRFSDFAQDFETKYLFADNMHRIASNFLARLPRDCRGFKSPSRDHFFG